MRIDLKIWIQFYAGTPQRLTFISKLEMAAKH